MRRELRALAGELRGLLAGQDVTAVGKRELAALLRDIEAAIDGRYAAIAQRADEEIRELAAIEAAWAQQASRLPRPASASAITAVSAGLLIFGTPLAAVWEQQRDDLVRRIAGVVRETAAGQAPPDRLIPRVLGQGRAGREAGGLIQRAAAQADTLAHTTVAQAANDARIATWKANGVNAFRWHAVLDERTTAGCALRHGLLYDLDTLEPIRHDIPIEREPPRHWNCRAILLPVAYGPDIPMPEDGGQSTFREYFDGLTEAEQDRLFGQGRADLFRRGVITQSDLVGQRGQVLTLRELRESGIVSAYADASTGGQYAGFFTEHAKYSDAQLQRSVRSLQKTIAEHEAWVQDPFLKLSGDESAFEISNLVNKKWPKDIARNRAYLEIVQGILRGRGT
ncbi:MAG: minor capsid protein [Lysobacteraceae bacterium]